LNIPSNANPDTLLTSEYLIIRNDGLSDKAKELYTSVFKVDISKLYLDDYVDDYTSIWKYILNPYLMTNAEKMRGIFNNIYNGLIKDLIT